MTRTLRRSLNDKSTAYEGPANMKFYTRQQKIKNARSNDCCPGVFDSKSIKAILKRCLLTYFAKSNAAPALSVGEPQEVRSLWQILKVEGSVELSGDRIQILG